MSRTLARLASLFSAFGTERIQAWRLRHARRARRSQRREDMLLDASRAAEQLRTLFNTAPDAIIGLDLAGHVVSFNHAAEHMFRIVADDARTLELAAIFPDVDMQWIMNALAEGSTTYDSRSRTARLHTTAERRGGMRFPAELNLGCLAGEEYSKATNITCIVRDMTDAERADEQMRLYKRAIAASSNGICISDVTLPDHPILYVNPAFERMTGYDMADVLGRNCRFLQGPDTDPSATAKIRLAITRGAECQVTLKNHMQDGTPFWNHLTLAPVRDRNGRVTHYIGIETDITEIKQIEAALEERRQQLDAIFTLSPDGFVAFGRDQHVTYINPAFLRITGLERDAVQGASAEQLDALIARIADPGHADRSLVSILTDATPRSGGSYETTLTPHASHPSASSSSLHSAARYQDLLHLRNPAPKVLQRSLRRAQGGTAGATVATEFVLYLRDITRESEVDRMKSEFLSSAAHELRTPMASIHGFAELLLRRNYDEDTRRELLDTIHKQSKHLTKLVNELLDLARIEARGGRDFLLEEQSVAPLIRETTASILVANDPRRVEIELPDALPLVRIDASKMRQALTNILSNAYKYSPSGSRIELGIERRTAGERDFLGIRVRDEGMGMTPEQLMRACERFYRADASGAIPGTGLGLALVKEIMALQGGSVEIASEPERGTSVTLWLPVSSPRLQALAA